MQSNLRKIQDGLNGVVALDNKVSSPTSGLSATTGMIKISSHDNTPDYAEIKLIAGTGITFTKQHPYFNESLLISAHVPVTLATNHGLGLSGQVINMGTPSTCTNVTTNAVTTATHTHAITGFLTAVTAHDILSATHGDSTAGSATSGDIIYADATPKWTRLAKGADGKVLTLVSGIPSWETAGGVGAQVILSATHTDTLADSVLSGDILIGNATPKWARLAKGLDGKVLTLTSGLPSWEALPAGAAHDLLSATHGDTTASSVTRGDIIIGSGASPKWDNLAVGASTTYLAGGTEPSWATLNQAAVDDLMTTDSPVFVTVKLTDLTDDYIPYHVNDATGLANGPTKTNVDSAVSLKHAAVTLAADHGLGLTGQVLNMGTPSTCTAATTNAVSTTTHTHAITGFLTGVTAHNLLSTTHGDTLADSVAAGDIMFGNATPKWARLAKATDGWVLTLVSGLPAWAAGGGYTDEQAQDAVGAMIGPSLQYVDATPLLDTIQDIRTSAAPQFTGLNISDGSNYACYYAGYANGDMQWIVSYSAASHNLILGKIGTGAYDGALRLLYGSSPLYADLTYSLLNTLQTTGSPTFVNVYASCITDPVVEIADAEPAGRANGHLWYDSDGTPSTGANEKVKASSDDPTSDYLDGKVAKSVVITDEKLELSGDSATPGNLKYYGTNADGTKGFNDIPSGLVGSFVPRATYKKFFSLTPHQALAHGVGCVTSVSGTLAMIYSGGVSAQTMATAATATAYSAVYTALMISELGNPDYNVVFSTSAAIDNEYIWAGLFSDITVVGTADPKTRNIAALRYVSGTANWYLYTSNGATSTATDTGLVVATSTEYTVRVWTVNLGVTWNVTINGGNLTQSTTNVPTGPFITGLKVETKANSARNISWKYIEQFHG